MNDSEHKRGSKKGKFCATPGTPCSPCGNDYIDVCRPSWSTHTFARLIRRKTGTINFQKTFEAHHVLCVAPVSSEVVAKPGIDAIIAETEWCINNTVNMLAMPLWGHSIVWYCDVVSGTILGSVVPPPFANIPQHDWDHNGRIGYTREVESDLKQIANEIQQQGHAIKPDNVKGALDALSKKWKGELAVRGARLGGTDAGWKLGMASPVSAWCLPFSMASTGNVEKKGFPARRFDEQAARWIKRIAEAIAGAA